MSRKIRGEGADGFFLKNLTECIGRLGAIDPTKAQKLREMYHAEIFKNPLAVENPKDYLRHEGVILERMFSAKALMMPVPAPEPPKPDVIVPLNPTSPAMSADDDFGLGDIDIEPEPVNPYTDENGVLAQCLNEWTLFRKHPYVRTVVINDGTKTQQPRKFLVIGTAVVHGQTGNTVNINCTTGNFKKIRECDETVLVHFNGRPVSMSKDGENGTAFFVWLCHYNPGKVFRFWMNRQEVAMGTRKDDPRGTFRILITTEGDGWRKVAA
jgi:hypothetical protein